MELALKAQVKHTVKVVTQSVRDDERALGEGRLSATKSELAALWKELADKGRELATKELAVEQAVDRKEELEDQLHPTLLQNNILMAKVDGVYLLAMDVLHVAEEGAAVLRSMVAQRQEGAKGSKGSSLAAAAAYSPDAYDLEATTAALKTIKHEGTRKLESVVEAVASALGAMPLERARHAAETLSIRHEVGTSKEKDDIGRMISQYLNGTTAGR